MLTLIFIVAAELVILTALVVRWLVSDNGEFVTVNYGKRGPSQCHGSPRSPSYRG